MNRIVAFCLASAALSSCQSVVLDLSDLKQPVMLNSGEQLGMTGGPGVRDFQGVVASSATITSSQTRNENVNNVQEAAFQKVGGEADAGITDVEIQLRSSSTYPLLFFSQYVEARISGVTHSKQAGQAAGRN